MKTVKVENNEYELIEDHGNCFNVEEFETKCTDYFFDFDYIVGDYAYNKLRLKGFCDKGNKRFNKINDFSLKDRYIYEQCAYNCRYFVLKKVKKA